MPLAGNWLYRISCWKHKTCPSGRGSSPSPQDPRPGSRRLLSRRFPGAEPAEGTKIALPSQFGAFSQDHMSSTHEDFKREIHGRGPSDRNFGFVFTAVFLFLALWPLRHGRPVRFWALALSVAFFSVTVVRPSWLHAANRVWTQCGILIGKVVNPVSYTHLEAGARLREIRDRRIRKGRKDWQGNPKSTIALIEPPTMTIVFRAAAAFSDCAACRT